MRMHLDIDDVAATSPLALKELAELRADSRRLEMLESYARKPGGILLHAETTPTGRLGIGLAHRKLRDACDAIFQAEA